jgi:DNA adenine methylase
MSKNRIVNVASVPQRSPFRYPGGKTWLVPQIRRWLTSLPNKPKLLLEPFAGGGIVSLTVGFEQLAEHVCLVERDEDVAAVWQTILSTDVKWLAKRIVEFQLTLEHAKEVMNSQPSSTRQRAFRTILKNRIFHGGILAPGSSMIKEGENGKGLGSRWYPTTLKTRILNIHDCRERFTFIAGDGLEVLEKHQGQDTLAVFVDPPYTAAGKKAGARLYLHNEVDHDRLFQMCSQVQGSCLMTYDNATGVQELAKKHSFDFEPIAMKNTHHAEMTELLISRNLAWLRASQNRAVQRSLFD